LIAIPFFFLFGLLLDLVRPLFDLIANFLRNLAPGFRPPQEETQIFVDEIFRRIESLVPYLRLLGVIAVILLAGWIIARALTRRLKWAEEEMFVREALDDRDRKPEPRPRNRAVRPPRVQVNAENIRRIYAAMLVHARSLGLERRQAETPLEFLPRLSASFPASSVELGEITNAYIAVHYAEQPATDDQVRSLRAVWQRVKAQMTSESSDAKRRTGKR
jgi:hypothetical protein